MDDSPGPEVWALLGGRALRVGLGCDGASRVGPTRVWYLLCVGATEEEPSASATAVEAAATTAGEAPTTRELGSASELGPKTTAAPGVEVSAGGVGPWRTRGRKE